MKLPRPKHWVEGERAVAVEPRPASRVRERWSGRLNFYSGRTLTYSALNLEQRHRSGRLAMLGRQLSPGVVRGLELSAEPETDTATARTVLRVSTGMALDCCGEDLTLARPLRVRIDDLPVLGQDPTDPSPARGVGIVMLQPVVGEDGGRENVDDPCEIDPDNDAFEDWQLVDGARLAWFPWPAEWFLPLPGPRFRNELAYRVFDRELRVGELPWHPAGAALGLVQVADDGAAAFVDRHAVVRRGGSTAPRSTLAGGRGSDYLWQARLLQFSDHLRDVLEEGVEMADAFQRFRYLPPAGALPAEALQLAERRAEFLPSRYTVAAVPAPREQLEVALEASASLLPFDLFVADRLQVVVPVPHELYEPRLLKRELINPVFGDTVREFMAVLAQALGARNRYRAMAPAVQGAVDAAAVTAFEALDPEAVPGEEPAAEVEVDEHGAEARRLLGELHARLDSDYPLSDAELAEIDPDSIGDDAFTGLKPFIASLEQKIRESDDRVDFGFLRLQTDIYRMRQMMLGSVEATRLATSPVLAGIAQGVTSHATQQNLASYFEMATGGQAPPAAAAAGSGGTGGVEGGGTRAFTNARTAGEGDAAGAGEPVMRMMRRPIEPEMQPRYMAMAGGTDELLAAKYGSYSAGVEAEVLKGLVESGAAAGQDEVTGQSAIVGEARLFRSATVAERIAEPPGPEVKSYAVASKAEVLGSLAGLPINVAGVSVPLASNDRAVLSATEYQAWVEDQSLAGVEQAVLRGRVQTSGSTVTVFLGPLNDAERKTLGDQADHFRQALNALLGRNGHSLDAGDVSGMVLAGLFDPDPTDGDEAAFLSVGVNALEVSVAALRKVEGRVERYRKAVAECKKVLAELESVVSGWQVDLDEADDRLAESRHDVTVARALRDEEQARLDAINERRRKILDQHVEFLFFTRPRTVSLTRDVAATPLRGVYEDPLPACLAANLQAPDELEELVDAFREVPLRWLVHARLLILRLDRPALLKGVFQAAKQSALLRVQASAPLRKVVSPPAGAPAGAKGVAQVLGGYRMVRHGFLQTKAALNLSFLDTSSWKQVGEKAQDDLSLADLMDSGRGRSALAQRATRELESIESVATCLYQRFVQVPAAVRLSWVDDLSQFDDPTDLRDLDVLQGWDTLDQELRRDLQRLAGWLFGRVDAQVPGAVALANDLVRVCILLASHAPVSSIVEGHLPEPVGGRIGDLIDLVLDRGNARVGMQVGIYQNLQVAVQGVVEDLAQDAVRVRVTKAAQEVFQVAQGAKARFWVS